MEMCSLYDAIGRRESCPGESCAFWENGGCGITQLAAPIEGRPDIVAWLLDLRHTLEAQRPGVGLGSAAFRRSLAKGKE